MSKQKVLEIARRQIGAVESPAGSNKQKYGVWYGMNGAPWCAIWVSYCFYMGGLPLPATTPKGFAYCPFGVNWFKKQGRWLRSNPQVGDVVFFTWVGRGLAQHVGIVEKINEDGTIGTIEGNTSPSNDANGGKVMRRTRSRSVILGYGRPDWSKSKSANDPIDKMQHPSWSGRFLQLTTPYMQGDDIKTWQEQMIERGWDLGEDGADGIYGQATRAVAIAFQREKGLGVDGVVGPVTWNAAWELPVT